MAVLAIKRKEQYSPNHVGNDGAILEAVCRQLSDAGQEVEICDEASFITRQHIQQDFIINMGRSNACLLKLQEATDNGKQVINSAKGVRQCFRKNMTLELLAAGIPYPASYVVNTAADISETLAKMSSSTIWIKRGDFHAINREDVSFASSIEEAKSIVKEFALRDIHEAVLSEHLVGDLLKFYAVRGTDFFYWFYPYEHNHHKYAIYETINGGTLHYPFQVETLMKIAEDAAEQLGVYIYGGDAIVSPNGDLHIIDLNDWPSFAPCRSAASDAIAAFLLKKINTR